MVAPLGPLPSDGPYTGSPEERAFAKNPMRRTQEECLQDADLLIKFYRGENERLALMIERRNLYIIQCGLEKDFLDWASEKGKSK